MTLKEKLIKKCKNTNTSIDGINLLLEYYKSSLRWNEEKAINYILKLFENGTIDTIKFIGKDNKEI